LSTAQLLAPDAITLRIAAVRGQRVLLDADLAALYDPKGGLLLHRSVCLRTT
jgi:hypothetical protein